MVPKSKKQSSNLQSQRNGTPSQENIFLFIPNLIGELYIKIFKVFVYLNLQLVSLVHMMTFYLIKHRLRASNFGHHIIIFYAKGPMDMHFTLYYFMFIR